MKRYLKNVSGSNIMIGDIGQMFDTITVEEITNEILDEYIYSSDLETEILAGNIQVGATSSFFYTDPYEGILYLKSVFDDNAYLLDGTTFQEVTVAIVEDTYANMKSTTYFMNMLTMMRDLYNAASNPIYLSNHTPILGEDGILQDHSDKIDTIETSMAKNGWYTQTIRETSDFRPLDLLIYYGWLNAFNYGEHSWSNEKVAQDMAQYSVIVLGDGIADPSHGDYSNAQVIIPRIQALNPKAKIFGYVSVYQSLANFKSKVDDWANLGVYGIFMDEAGYDFGTTATNDRDAFNEKVDYIHGVDSTNDPMYAFANAGNMDHIIGTTNDLSYPNTTWNPSLTASNLNLNDWYLLESHAVNTTVYSSSDGYNTKASWASNGVKAIEHRYTYGINVASVGIVDNDSTAAQELSDFAFVSACMFSFEAHGISDTGYGASSSTVDFYNRPDIIGIGDIWSLSPSVQNDISDNDVYWRFLEFGNFMLDFSTGAHTYEITKKIIEESSSASPSDSTATCNYVPKIFQGVSTTAQNQTSAADLVIEWDDETRKDSIYTHSNGSNPDQITISETGWYRITYSVSWVKLSNSRTTKRMWVEDDGTPIGHSTGYCYMRDGGYGSRGTVSASFVSEITSGSVIDVHAEQTNNNTTFGDSSASCSTIADECWILIEKI